MTPIRVLCVFSTLDRGGAESMCMNLYRHIDRDKVQFDFIKHTQKKGAYEDEIYFLGGRIFEAPRLNTGNVLKYRKWWSDFLENHPEFTIIHGHFFTISAVYFQIAKKKKRKTVGHIHISKAANFRKIVLSKFISRYTDYCFACSITAGKWVYGKRPFKVINNAINVDQFRFNAGIRECVRSDFSFDNNLIIGCVGRFDRQKNPFGILDIFRLVHEKRLDSKLLWIGDGIFREDLVSKAQEEGLEKDIIFTGVRKDVDRLLQAMDVFIMPSLYEGLPVAAIEAQAAGLPCFLSDRITEEVDVTGHCCFLTIDSPKIWADSILKCNIEREDTCDKIKAAGYDINNTARKMQEFYLQISKVKNKG